MLEKYKKEIKGAVISTGIWITVLGIFPGLHNWYSDVNGQIFVGIGLLALGWFWL